MVSKKFEKGKERKVFFFNFLNFLQFSEDK